MCLNSLLCCCAPQGGYSLTLTLPEDDRYFADKADILERNGLGASATFGLVRGQEPSLEMMGFLRLMQLSGERVFAALARLCSLAPAVPASCDGRAVAQSLWSQGVIAAGCMAAACSAQGLSGD